MNRVRKYRADFAGKDDAGKWHEMGATLIWAFSVAQATVNAWRQARANGIEPGASRLTLTILY